MIEPRTVVIGDHEYQLMQLPAMSNMRMLSRVCGIVGPAVSQIKGLNMQRMKAEKDISVIGHVLTAVADKLNPTEMESLTATLLDTLKRRDALSDKPFLDCGPKSAGFNEFAGRAGTVLRLLAFAMEINFGDFFGGARTMLAGVLAQAKAALAEEKDDEPSGNSSSSGASST